MITDKPATVNLAGAQEGCETQEAPRRWWTFITDSALLGLVIVLVVIFAAFSVLLPNFLTARNMEILASSISMIGIVAAGMTLVIIGGGLDLSVASNIALTSVIIANALVNFHWSEPAAVGAGIAVGLIIGLFNGTLIAGVGINAVIATLASYSITRWGAYLLGNKGGQAIPLGYEQKRPFFDFIGQGNIGGIPVPFILMLVILVVIWLLLVRTRFGREFFAVGGNPLAAKMTGISVRWYTFLAFTLTGLISGMAGVIYASRLAGGYPSGANGWELDIITAVFLGGTSLTGGQGTILGTLLGVITIGTLRNGMALMGVDIAAQNIVTGVVLLAAMLYNRIKHGSAE